MQSLILHDQQAIRPASNDSCSVHFYFKNSQTLQNGICNPGVARYRKSVFVIYLPS